MVGWDVAGVGLSGGVGGSVGVSAVWVAGGAAWGWAVCSYTWAYTGRGGGGLCIKPMYTATQAAPATAAHPLIMAILAAFRPVAPATTPVAPVVLAALAAVMTPAAPVAAMVYPAAKAASSANSTATIEKLPI